MTKLSISITLSLIIVFVITGDVSPSQKIVKVSPSQKIVKVYLSQKRHRP